MPPKISFTTRIWHPNISSVTGTICLDTLSTEWTPSLSVFTTLLSIRSLLASAEPNDPQDAMVAKQYLNNFREYVATAKYWTNEFAAKNPNYANKKESTKNVVKSSVSREMTRVVTSDHTNRQRLITPIPSAKQEKKVQHQPQQSTLIYPEKSDEQRLLEYKQLHEKIMSYKIGRTKALEVLTLQNWDLEKTMEQLNIVETMSILEPVTRKRSRKSTASSSSSRKSTTDKHSRKNKKLKSL